MCGNLGMVPSDQANQWKGHGMLHSVLRSHPRGSNPCSAFCPRGANFTGCFPSVPPEPQLGLMIPRGICSSLIGPTTTPVSLTPADASSELWVLSLPVSLCLFPSTVL